MSSCNFLDFRRRRYQNVKAPIIRAQRARAAMMMPAVAPALSLRVGGGVCGTLVMLPGPVEFVLLMEGMAIIC